MGERIELADGNWWEIKERLTKGNRRKINRHGQDTAIQLANRIVQSGVDITELRKSATTPSPNQQTDDEDDMMLVVGTVAWSWPEPVSLESVYDRDEADAEIVLARMRELYRSRVAAERDELKNG